MGEIVVEIELVNVGDREKASDGMIPASEVRRAIVPAVADTGAISMVIPEDVVQELGLPIIDHASTQMADGSVATLPIAGSLGVKIHERVMDTDCLVVPTGTEALIGVVVMERLDLILDPKNEIVTVRPESPHLPLLRA